MSSLIMCDQAILNWNCIFSTNSLSWFGLFEPRWHKTAKLIWLLVCVLEVCFGPSLFIPYPMWLLTPGPLSTSYWVWSFGLSSHTCFLSVSSWFSLTNLMALITWKGRNPTLVPTHRFQSLTVAPIQPNNSPNPYKGLQSLNTPVVTPTFPYSWYKTQKVGIEGSIAKYVQYWWKLL